jgi:hypothetical protein
MLVLSKTERIKQMPALQVVASPAKRSQELFLQIGRKRYQVASIGEAVKMYELARDRSGFGASKMPQVKITAANGLFLYGVAYNGRVWTLGADGSQVFLDGVNRDTEWCKQFAIGTSCAS